MSDEEIELKKFVIEFGPREIGVALACALTFGGGFAAVQSYTGEAQENGLPMVLPYQGTLSKAGAPFTGTQAMQFKLYSDTSGAAFWTSDSRNVEVVGGKFAVTLGDANDANKLEAQDFRHSELYVELVVDGTTLSPKQRIAPAPQAITAAQAQHADNGVPVGTITAFAGETVPPGWLLCDGRGLSSAGQYGELYTSIGELWGDGTSNCVAGACDFNLPDLRGVFLRGLDGGRGIDPESGRLLGSSQDDALQDHHHNLFRQVANNYPGSGPFAASHGEHAGGQHSYLIVFDSSEPNAYLSSGVVPGYRDAAPATETRPNNIAVNYIIKY